MDIYQQYIFKSRYAQNNETWEHAIDRALNFLNIHNEDIRKAIINMEVMPSMRLLATAGPAAERDNAAIYNCSYTTCDDISTFGEILYLLTCRVGVGFSVEQKFIEKLPNLQNDYTKSEETIIVEDDRIGWAEAFNKLISYLYKGIIPFLDYSKIRQRGTPLKTFGGFASGYVALEDLFNFTIKIFNNAKTKKLKPIECYDILTKCAECIEQGGVQNTAMMCLFDDEEMALAKSSNNWFVNSKHRRHSNNTRVIYNTISSISFLNIWNTLAQSGSGEPGIFNRTAAMLREEDSGCGLNPCGEVILKPRSFCNLTEVICRHDDTIEEIHRKLIIATKLGVYQSMKTNFRFLSNKWKENAESNRLLGVSLTGIADCKIAMDNIDSFYPIVKKTADNLCDELGITKPKRYTCIKPSGTVSQLCSCSAGIHPSISEYYIRAVREGNNTITCKKLIEVGVPNEQDSFNIHKRVFYFPKQSKSKQLTQEEFYKLYLKYVKKYADHNVSVTLFIDIDEWLKIGNMVLEDIRNNNIIGMAFLPKFNTIYPQMPFVACTKEKYEELKEKMPDKIDWEEGIEHTTVSECSSGICEIKKK